MRELLKGQLKRIVVLLSVGLVLSLVMKRSMGVSGALFFSNMLFIISIVFITTALWQLVLNMGLFNSMIFGGKCLYRIFTKKLGTSPALKDEYVEYTNSRSKYTGIPVLLAIGLGMLGLSVLPILMGKTYF